MAKSYGGTNKVAGDPTLPPAPGEAGRDVGIRKVGMGNSVRGPGKEPRTTGGGSKAPISAGSPQQKGLVGRKYPGSKPGNNVPTMETPARKGQYGNAAGYGGRPANNLPSAKGKNSLTQRPGGTPNKGVAGGRNNNPFRGLSRGR